MRKVYVEDLPHGGSRYVPNSRVNWMESVGHKVKFVYDEMEGEFEIIKCEMRDKKKFITFTYQNEQYERFVGDFSQCKIASVIGLRTKRHRHQIGEIITMKNGDVKLIAYTDIQNGKKGKVRGYTYECLTCQHQNNISEGHLKERLSCPVCVGQVVKVGYNDMWTTNAKLASLLMNPDDGYRYLQNSNLRADWKCPECSNVIKQKKISNIKHFGLSCPACSDGISYPEKFVYHVLDQAGVEFESQKLFLWSENKRYDFYIPSLNVIIEVHGRQHYDEIGFSSLGGQTLVEQQKMDAFKEKNAYRHGVTRYFVIDAQKSEIDYIKQSIETCGLKEMLDVSNVDWLKCHEYAVGTLIKKVSNLWESGIRDLHEIGRQVLVGAPAVRRMLKKGALLGWCDYTPEVLQKQNLVKMQKSRRRKVICLTTNEIFESIQDASKKYKVSDSKITSACRGNQKTSGKHPITGERLKWMYLEEYEDMIAEPLESK